MKSKSTLIPELLFFSLLGKYLDTRAAQKVFTNATPGHPLVEIQYGSEFKYHLNQTMTPELRCH